MQSIDRFQLICEQKESLPTNTPRVASFHYSSRGKKAALLLTTSHLRHHNLGDALRTPKVRIGTCMASILQKNPHQSCLERG